MKPDDIQTAISGALLQGGQSWMIATIVAFLPVLWTMSLMLHLGRPYVLRTLRRCGLRLGADVWWMSYLIIRDALLLVTFGLSFIFFNPNLVAIRSNKRVVEAQIAAAQTAVLAPPSDADMQALRTAVREAEDVIARNAAVNQLVKAATALIQTLNA